MNHLFFPDDRFLYFRAIIYEWPTLNHIVGIYEAAYGQQPNRDNLLFLARIQSKQPKHT